MLKPQRALLEGTERALTPRRGARGKVRVKEEIAGRLVGDSCSLPASRMREVHKWSFGPALLVIAIHSLGI